MNTYPNANTGLEARSSDELSPRFSFKKFGRGLLGGLKLMGAGALTTVGGILRRGETYDSAALQGNSALNQVLARSSTLAPEQQEHSVLLTQRDIDSLVEDILARRDVDNDADITQREFDEYMNDVLARAQSMGNYE